MFSMKSRYLLAVIMTLCFGFVLFALYLQHYKAVDPCTLCVLQRYAFIAIGLICLYGALTGLVRISATLGFIASVTGVFLAAYQLWIIAHPVVICGRDHLEEWVNQLSMARWLPGIFKADGYCSEQLDPVMALTPPQWTFVWFLTFTIVLLLIALKRRR